MQSLTLDKQLPNGYLSSDMPWPMLSMGMDAFSHDELSKCNVLSEAFHLFVLFTTVHCLSRPVDVAVPV